MIKKSLLFLTLIIVIWSLLIQIKPFSASQHQWQKNLICAEKFKFDEDSISDLIVGSSLAARINMDNLPNYYNLSLGGQSIFDGLNILRSKKHLPSNVFIEINFIEKPENQTFEEIISSPILNALKQNFSIFRADKQPIALIGNKFFIPVVEAIVSPETTTQTRTKINSNDSINEKTSQDNSILTNMLNLQIESYSKPIDTSKMNNQFQTLSKHIKFLKSKGINIIFFEMPVNPKLISLNKATYLRTRIKKEYPNYKFIQFPKNIEDYKTTDGIHLTEEESKAYSNYFRKESVKFTANIF